MVEWNYVKVRRLSLYIEKNIHSGTQWAVFEPNDERLWARIRCDVEDFMRGIFRRGILADGTPEDAYFVKCGGEATTLADIDNGIVNLQVGFAPHKPAEFLNSSSSQSSRKPGRRRRRKASRGNGGGPGTGKYAALDLKRGVTKAPEIIEDSKSGTAQTTFSSLITRHRVKP